MPTFTQTNRVMAVSTLLGPDGLLLERFSGTEAVSELFRFHLDLLAERRTTVAFNKLLAQPITVTVALPSGACRYFSGIVSRFSQGPQVRSVLGEATFVRYRAEMVPSLWLLGRNRRCRIFQQLSVPDILKKVLGGLSVSWQFQGQYEPRDYCVQYRESDFAFASRLMEEEGIYYYFQHSAAGHTLVVADTPGSHRPVPGPEALIYETMFGGVREEDRIHRWEKIQEVRSSKHTLWDHCFELPGQNLMASRPILDEVQVGSVRHPLRFSSNGQMEVYDYPGGYAQRFDGITPGGGARAAELRKIFQDNERTVRIRAEQEAAPGLVIEGESDVRHLTAGHRFTLTRHFDADGDYVLTRVEHEASQEGTYTSTALPPWSYRNRFQCLPLALPFRPQRATPRARVEGPQTAVVVGPKGEEIFTDQYGRVKVQFPWDREGKFDADSSCWVRVSQVHAGKRWGGIDIPRVGEEVIVDFLEGDPDRPIITGRVYNAEQMPPNGLPEARMVSGLKSHSYPGGGGFNEISMDDTKGKERLFTHAQYDNTNVVNHDRTTTVGNDSTESIGNNRTEAVKVDAAETVGNNQTIQVGNNQTVLIGMNQLVNAGQNVVINAGTSITLKCGASTLYMNQAGVIFLSGTLVSVTGSIHAHVGAPLTLVAGVATVTAGVLTVSEGVAVNKVHGGKTTVDGNPVKINC